jgi:two-component system OmpR family response regulator
MDRTKKMKVFLVDDDTMFTESLKHVLKEDKTDITVFSTGEDCLKSMENKKEYPKVVVLDYLLNGAHPSAMNGVQVLNKIKQADPDVEVIMLSAQNDVNIAMDTMKYGAYDYIGKGQYAFAKIRSDIKRLSDIKKQTDDFDKETRRLKRINIFIVLLVILAFILGKIL